jgi:DNA-binding CsgD family transcriptional regulator/tetratricopeptide (TPR) repeat protein
MSPVFAGRESELAVLTGAFEAAAGGAPATVLLGAEAGGGKSRLVTEFTMRVAGRALLLAGGCVQVSAAGLPYAPFTAALRELVRERDAAEVASLVPGSGAGELALLLPEFGAPPAGGDPETARARLFELLLTVFEALADQQPVVLIVEDVHWADQPTCDLLRFLVRNLRRAAVTLLVTFRSDSIPRGHPVRGLLAGLERMAGVARLDLPRLSRDQVAVQLEGILGHPPAPAVTNAVYARGGGNPLFTEALLGRDGSVSAGLPASLSDLLLATVTSLPEQTQQLVRIAAVGGPRVSHALLATAARCDDASLTAGLRPAVAASVMVTDTDGYAFRHELIREAVTTDSLPGERAQAHRRFAEILETTPSLSPAGIPAVQVAQHWLGAGEAERALAAAWQAAAAAGGSFAYAEQFAMADQVLNLWDRVPDPVRLTGTGRIGVLLLAADAARWSGQPERGLAVTEAALAQAAGADARQRPSLLLRRAGLRRELLLPGQIDDLRAALDLTGTASRMRAQVMAQLCWALRREDRHEEAARLAGDLRVLADQLGDEECQVEAAMLLAAVGAQEGQDTVAALAEAGRRAASIGAGHLEAWAFLTASHVLEGRGSHEPAIRTAREGLTRARELGLAKQVAAPIAGNLAESLASVGRWDEALEILEEVLSLDLPPRGRIHPLLVRGQIATARGDAETTERTLRELGSLPTALRAEGHYALPLAQLEIGHRLATGDIAGALAVSVPAAAGEPPSRRPQPDPRYVWALLATAMAACAEASLLGPAARTVDQQQLRRDLEDLAAGVARRNPLHDAHALVFAAEAARADGRHDLAAWDSAAKAWDVLGQPYPQAYALLRAAGAAAARDDREGAAGRLRRAAELAGQVAAHPLRERVSQFARRARIPLPGPGDDRPAIPFGLTSREQEVLRLVAAGRSNRDIAAELFISPRTASVHVSNILGKLGVATRGEAAATAHRLHLFDDP